MSNVMIKHKKCLITIVSLTAMMLDLFIIVSEKCMASWLNILDYDITKTSARYRAVVNDDQVVVVLLQSVDTKDTPLSQLSLCPGVPESDLVFSSVSITKFLIEKVEDEIVYR